MCNVKAVSNVAMLEARCCGTSIHLQATNVVLQGNGDSLASDSVHSSKAASPIASSSGNNNTHILGPPGRAPKAGPAQQNSSGEPSGEVPECQLQHTFLPQYCTLIQELCGALSQ